MKKLIGLIHLLILVLFVCHVAALALALPPPPTHSEYGGNGARRLLGLRQRQSVVPPGPCSGCSQLEAQAQCQRALYRITRAWTPRDSTQFWKTARTHKVTFSKECCDVVSTFEEYYKEHTSRKILFNPAAIGLIEAKCIVNPTP